MNFFSYFSDHCRMINKAKFYMENIDWGSLPFGYFRTEYNIRCYWRDGEWKEIEVSSSEYLNLHIAATCLHYGQEAFEGPLWEKEQTGTGK